MKMVKNSVVVIALLVCAATGSAFAKDNSYVAACKSDVELRNSMATLHGQAQVDKHIGAVCGCRYTSLLKEGISAIDIQKIMDKKYGVADPQMQKFLAAAIRAGFQCLNAGSPQKADEQGLVHKSPPAVTNEPLVVKGISIGMTKQQVLELFPQIQRENVIELTEDNPNYYVGDALIVITSEDALSCVSFAACNKMSFAEKVPYGAFFVFIEGKLVSFKTRFHRADPSQTRTRANSDDKIYEEIKSAFSEKFKTKPGDIVVSLGANSFDSSESSVTYCVWKNSARNEQIRLADRFATDESLVEFNLEAVNYDDVKLQRKKVFEEVQAKAKAEAEQEKAKAAAEEARKRKADL